MTTSSETDSMQMRRIGRSIAAVFAGFIAVVVLSLATDQVFHSLGVYPPWDQPMTDTGLLLLALTYRTIYGILGSFIAAWLAPRAPMTHALVLGAIGFVLAILGAVAMWHFGAHWYPISLILTALPGAWIGGRLQGRLRSRP